VGVSLLHAAGLGELVAADEGAYVEIAARVAQDAAGRAAWRAGLRERLATGPLCDGARFGAEFGRTIRGMWQDWCGRGG
jgi:predicted O-linked N-acetylglucosamine transferase (SPINDLY family)